MLWFKFSHVFIIIIWSNGKYNNIETSSKNIKPRINLNHNRYFHEKLVMLRDNTTE